MTNTTQGKHTPGPWEGKIQDVKGRIYVRQDSTKAHVAIIKNGLGGLGEVSANAALIAAAPEMLEMLKAASGALMTYTHHQAVRRDIENIIAKAEGR